MNHTGIEIGDYLAIGHYQDESVLWRCVFRDETGPLLLSDRVLCIKPFDAAGRHVYPDGTPQADFRDYRSTIGSNLWETSNLRAWLQSDAPAGGVVWPDNCAPTRANLWDAAHPYADEQGFLSKNHFTTDEKSIIKSILQESLLNDLDICYYEKQGLRRYDILVDVDLENKIQECIPMYSSQFMDTVFLLDVLQQERVRQNGWILGDDYYKASSSFWLRTPLTKAADPSAVLYVNTIGIVGCITSHSDHIGVRPAFYLEDSSRIVFRAGDGSALNPFRL